MKTLKLVFILGSATLLSLCAFTEIPKRAVCDMYPVISMGVIVTTFTVNDKTLSDLRQNHCISFSSSVCVVHQIGSSPAVYQSFVLGGRYIQ